MRIPEVVGFYKSHNIEFRELDVWPQGLTTITVDQAVRKAISLAKGELCRYPNALIGLSGHSLGAVVALIAATYLDIDFLILEDEDAAIGETPDWVLRAGGFDLENEAVITGLRKDCISVRQIRKLLADENAHLSPILEIRGWFAMSLNLIFGNFPLTGKGEVARFYFKDHTMAWRLPDVVSRVAQFVRQVEEKMFLEN